MRYVRVGNLNSISYPRTYNVRDPAHSNDAPKCKYNPHSPSRLRVYSI